MLSISLCEEKSRILPYSKKCKMLYSEALYMYLATQRGEVVAAALFEVGGDCVQTVYYEADDMDDFYLFDAVLRAGLNYASQKGLENGCIPEEFRMRHKELFSKINYPIHPVFSVENFFAKYKNCANMR